MKIMLMKTHSLQRHRQQTHCCQEALDAELRPDTETYEVPPDEDFQNIFSFKSNGTER